MLDLFYISSKNIIERKGTSGEETYIKIMIEARNEDLENSIEQGETSLTKVKARDSILTKT
jgi:hypothetical protein